jgi:hypothetical protein
MLTEIHATVSIIQYCPLQVAARKIKNFKYFCD